MSSSVLLRKEEEGFPPNKLFPSYSFAMEQQQQQQQQRQIQDLNSTSPTFKVLSTIASDEQSGTKKANWGNDSMFGSYGLSEHSSSSGLSTPFGSELGSTETDETESEDGEDFIAELTRQMADYMLKDDDEVEVSTNDNDIDEYKVPNFTSNIPQTIPPCGLAGTWSNYNSSDICYYQESLSSYVNPITEYSANQMKNYNTVTYSSDDLKRPIQVYHLKNQPTTTKHRPCNSRGKKAKGTTTESVQQLKTEINRAPIQSNGAGMRAIFLGGVSSINGSSSTGTGVFLPRRISPTTNEPKKKSGSSTVLIPARVLQALQLHFNHMDALSRSNTCSVSPTQLPKTDAKNETEGFVLKENQYSEEKTRPASIINDQEMQLPQEWTY